MEKRKNPQKPILARIYYIDKEIASGKYPNANTLAEGYGAGTATIYRDIEFMRDRLNAPIEYSAEHRGWYYGKKAYRLPASFASADDMLALGMAKSLLTLYKNTPLYDSAQRLLDEITVPLSYDPTAPFSSDKAIAWYEKRIIVPPVASAPVKDEIWEAIIDAMKQNKIINLEYKGDNDEDYIPRLIRPYQLLFDNRGWYLYGYAEDRSNIRLFTLSRMKSVSLTNKRFNLPKDFEYCTINDGSYFGIYIGKKNHYRIELTPSFYDYIKERQWAADQKVEMSKDKTKVIMEFSSTQGQRVLEWVLSLGMFAQPIKPSELVKEWKKHVKAMYEMGK
jgi:predicted DNA-binding transcriptional regulator YafY